MRYAWVGLGLWGCAAADVETVDGVPIATVTEDWPAEWATFEDQVLERVNRERFVGGSCGGVPMAGGLAPLEMDAVIRGTARRHSVDMAERGFFDHRNPDGDQPEDRMMADGFGGALPWGENIAAGAWDAETVMDGWMNSPGHCANILEPGFGVIGVGYAHDEDSALGHYWTQVFAGSH